MIMKSKQDVNSTPCRPAGATCHSGARPDRGVAAQLGPLAGTRGSMTQHVVSGIGAILVIGLVLIGVPALLITLFGNPLPTSDETAVALRLEPDWGNRTLLGAVLPCATWIAWALFAAPLLAEIVERRTGRRQRPSSSMFRVQRQVAATLVTAALFTVVAPTLPAAPSTAQGLTVTSDTGPSDAAAYVGFTSVERMEDGIDRGSGVPATGGRTYQVKSGDTLWAVADEYLESGRKFPAIVHASEGIEQPDGRQLTDPNLILPGWRLKIPTEHHVAPRSPEPRSAQSELRGSPRPAATSISTPGTTDEAAAPSAPSNRSNPAQRPQLDRPATKTDPERTVEVPPIAVPGGVAAVLAASLLAVLGGRRRTQRSVRKHGERAAAPAAAVRDVERQVAAVQDASTVEALHTALTHIQVWAEDTDATLPALFAVRADDEQIAVYLAEPAELPPPFESTYGDNTAWLARRTALTPTTGSTVAPYPALVTVGSDGDAGLLLLDLEQLQVLSITGTDTALQRAAMNAIAAELASSPWAEGIHLSLVGLPPDLPFELDPYRIHRVADVEHLCHDLRTHLADRKNALRESGLPDVRTARVVANELESWAPFVVLVATDCTPAEQDELIQLAHEYGSAGLVVVQARSIDDGFTIDLHSMVAASYQSANSGLPPLPFAPQILDDDTLAAVLELFATSNALPVAPSNPDMEDSFRAAASVPRPGTHEAELATAPAVSPDRARASERSLDENAPYLRVLGPIDALNIAGSNLMPGRGIEFLNYLLAHQQPVSGAQIQKALWPSSYDRSNNNTRTLAKQVRSALGHDSDGHLWLPEGRGTTGFTLHPAIRSDWTDFIAFTRGNPSAASTEDLEAALRLVRGQPLMGSDAFRGRWAWRTIFEEQIIAAILDTAEALADRVLRVGDLSLIHIAARTARMADPLNELSWQIELKAAAATSNSREVERIIDDLYSTAGAGDPDYEPDEATTQLIAAGRVARRPEPR